jgi:hypothetical protein
MAFGLRRHQNCGFVAIIVILVLGVRRVGGGDVKGRGREEMVREVGMCDNDDGV